MYIIYIVVYIVYIDYTIHIIHIAWPLFSPPFQHLLSERLTSLGIMGAPVPSKCWNGGHEWVKFHGPAM